MLFNAIKGIKNIYTILRLKFARMRSKLPFKGADLTLLDCMKHEFLSSQERYKVGQNLNVI
jgi:hypothetical protein